MRSHCLYHQERPATVRCSACLKPLCQECVYSTGEGAYCGATCHENATASAQRIAELKAKEAQQRGPNLVMRLVKLAVWGLILAAIVAAWPHLPPAITRPIEEFFKQIGLG